MSTSQRVVKNTLFLYVRTIVSLLVSVFTTRILLGTLGASDYGLYNVVGGSIAMLGFISASMSGVIQRYLSHAEGSGDERRIQLIFNNALIVHYILAVVTIILLGTAALFFFNGVLNIPTGKETEAAIIYGCMMASTVFSITIVPYDAEINAHENMLFYSILGIIDVMLKLLIAIVILYRDNEKLVFYAILMAAESFLLRFITQQYCRKHYEECRKVQMCHYYDKATIKEMTSFAGWNMTNTATGMISLFGMNIVINHYFGTELNAALGIATQLSGVLMGVSMNMIKAVTPVLVKSEGRNQRDRMLEISYVGCKFSYLLFAFVGVPVLVFLPYILNLWLHNVPEWTVAFCSILLVLTLVDQLTVLLYQSIMADGHIKVYNVLRSITNLMPILISIIMFSLGDFSPTWILINWLIWKGSIGGIVNLIVASKNLGLSVSLFFKRVIVKGMTVTVVVALVACMVKESADYLLLSELWGILTVFLLSLPLYWRVAFTQLERTIFYIMFSKVLRRV